MFFPFCCNPHPTSAQDYKQLKLKRLKSIRDFLESKLAATNAEIETVERQMATGDNAEAA
ncbi:MAG: hypothetical protein AAF810_04085 [Cyanobacteria bacterium P01_D01_bin.36]